MLFCKTATSANGRLCTPASPVGCPPKIICMLLAIGQEHPWEGGFFPPGSCRVEFYCTWKGPGCTHNDLFWQICTEAGSMQWRVNLRSIRRCAHWKQSDPFSMLRLHHPFIAEITFPFSWNNLVSIVLQMMPWRKVENGGISTYMDMSAIYMGTETIPALHVQGWENAWITKVVVIRSCISFAFPWSCEFHAGKY